MILVFSGGAFVMSAIVGLLCDMMSMKRVGIYVVVLSTLTFFSLFLGMHFQKLSLTYFLYFFVGASMFSMVTWILCACSKIYNGKFEAFSVAAQFVGMAMFVYDMLFIILEGKIGVHLRLNI